MAGGCRHAIAGDEHEPGLVALVVGDVGRDDLEAVQVGGHRGASAALAGVALGRRCGRRRRCCSTPAPRRPAGAHAGYRWHCAVATGIEVRPRPRRRARCPAGASRQCSMSSTTSRWISRSWSKASASWVKLTMPSIEFSIGDETEVDLARSRRRRARRARSGTGTCSAAARSVRVVNACSRERAERSEEADTLRHGASGYVDGDDHMAR